MSTLDAGLQRLYSTLASTGLPVFVGGSIAAMWYGEPRSTLDIDVVVKAEPSDAGRLAEAYTGGGFYVPPVEVIREELKRGARGSFNVVDLESGLKIDIYVAGDDALVAYGFEHARPATVGGATLNLAPATYVVAAKLRFYAISKQEKHLRDIRGILAISPELVDLEHVSAWAERFQVADAWESCRGAAGAE